MHWGLLINKPQGYHSCSHAYALILMYVWTVPFSSVPFELIFTRSHLLPVLYYPCRVHFIAFGCSCKKYEAIWENLASIKHFSVKWTHLELELRVLGVESICFTDCVKVSVMERTEVHDHFQTTRFLFLGSCTSIYILQQLSLIISYHWTLETVQVTDSMIQWTSLRHITIISVKCT